MNLPRSVADVLNDHVVFEVDCIDRMYCNVYMPGLQYAAGLVGYVHQQLGMPIASTAPLAKISDRFTAAVHRFARDQGVPWVDFARGQRKDDVMHEHLGWFSAAQGVVFIGRAPGVWTWSDISCVVILSGSSTCCMTLRELSCGRCSAAFLPGCGARGW